MPAYHKLNEIFYLYTLIKYFILTNAVFAKSRRNDADVYYDQLNVIAQKITFWGRDDCNNS